MTPLENRLTVIEAGLKANTKGITDNSDSLKTLMDMMEGFNARLAALEGDETPEDDEPLTADNAQVGDWVGQQGYYVGAIDPGESAVLAVSLNWEQFLEAVEKGGISRG